MKKSRTIKLEYYEFSNVEELDLVDRELVEEAKRVATQAYAPYSRFNVGSALRLSNGAIVTGSNQENSAYPSGLCAERVAMFSAHATFPSEKFETIAIYARAEAFVLEEAVTPCGACRQVMAEYEDQSERPLRVIMSSDEQVILVENVNNLLPFRFRLPQNS